MTTPTSFTDEEAILARREALLRSLRRGVVAVTGAVASATACPCLSQGYSSSSSSSTGGYPCSDGGATCEHDGGPADGGAPDTGHG